MKNISKKFGNVHFHLGSVTLTNTRGDHYTLGIAPTTTIEGKSVGNYRTIGIISSKNKLAEGSLSRANLKAYGTIYAQNELGDSENIGNINAFSPIAASNNLKENFKNVGPIDSTAILVAKNRFGKNSSNNGNITTIGGTNAINEFGPNVKLKKGSVITSEGFFAYNGANKSKPFKLLQNKIIVGGNQ